MHVTSLGAAREIQEGIAVDPLLVGCGAKHHDFDPNEVWKWDMREPSIIINGSFERLLFWNSKCGFGFL